MCSSQKRGSVSMVALTATSWGWVGVYPLAAISSASACSMSSVFAGAQRSHAEQFVKVSTRALSL